MAKDFYLFTLKMQKPLRCKILAEKNSSGRPGMSRYLLELYNPIPQSFYGWRATEESKKPFAKLCFEPHGGEQPYGQSGPFWGTVCSFQDETNADLNSPAGGLEGSFLCVSEEQVKEYIQFLDESKKGPYLLDIIRREAPTRDCRIIRDVCIKGNCIDGWKGYWLAEVDPPFPAQVFGRDKDFSRILLALDNLPAPAQPITFALCFIDQDVFIGESVTSQEIGLVEVGEGTLWRPKDREAFYRSLRKKGDVV